MDVVLGVVVAAIIVIGVLVALFELRVRQPDVLVLSESKGRISVRKGLFYPRHFSLPLKRTTCPIQVLGAERGELRFGRSERRR